MTRVTRSFPLALTLALGLGVWSCAVPPAPVLERQARVGSVSLVLAPRVVERPAIQAVVTQPTVASISRLDVIPMVETSPGVFQPFKADGTPTALGDPQAVMASQGLSSLKLDRGITLTGLARNTKYRVLARAYDAQGKLLSLDAGSTVDVTVGIDDAPASTALPVQLADVPFAGKTTIALINGATPNYATVVTSLVTVSGSTETLVPGSTQTLTKAQVPMLLTLDGLMANTTYRLNASLRDASNVQVATASVEIAVTNDDAPAGKTLSFDVVSSEPTGATSLIAGAYPTATSGFLDDTRTAARFNNPTGIAVDASGNLYVTESSNHAIRKISPAGVVSIFVGAYPTPSANFVDDAGTAARLNAPMGLAIDASGTLYVADLNNNAIRKVSPGGAVTTLAGGGPSAAGYLDATGTAAKFDRPSGICIDASGNLYVTDYDNHAIRKVTPSGVVTTVAGGGPSASGYVNGNGASARFHYPRGITVDASGNLYVVEHNNPAIRKITPAGDVTTLAGAGGTSSAGYVNGNAADARFSQPSGIAVDAGGNLYVADFNNHAIRKLTPAGVVSILAGSAAPATSGLMDDTGTNARFNKPHGIALDASGNLYVADTFNHVVRKIQ